MDVHTIDGNIPNFHIDGLTEDEDEASMTMMMLVMVVVLMMLMVVVMAEAGTNCLAANSG